MKILSLFGHPVIRDGQVSLADQIHDAICEEIHAGRWEIGERLPSMLTIAEQIGVSRMPVQIAMERLAEEGYVRQKDRSGIFLKSRMPDGREPLGTIGMVVSADAQTLREMENLAFEQLIVHRFIKAAADRNYQTRVHYATRDEDWKRINRRNRVFDEKIKGVISLVSFPRAPRGTLEADEIPLVFWCEPEHICAPCVASDYEMAFFHLTRELIAKGHRHISLLASPDNTQLLIDRYLAGYHRAMALAGLPTHDALLAPSQNLSLLDGVGLDRLLARHHEITAVLCMSQQRAEQVVSVVTMGGRSVPKDLTVVGTNPSPERMANGLRLSGVGYSPESEIDTCFTLLREQTIHRRWDVGTVLMSPYLIQGDTVAELLR